MADDLEEPGNIKAQGKEDKKEQWITRVPDNEAEQSNLMLIDKRMD